MKTSPISRSSSTTSFLLLLLSVIFVWRAPSAIAQTPGSAVPAIPVGHYATVTYFVRGGAGCPASNPNNPGTCDCTRSAAVSCPYESTLIFHELGSPQLWGQETFFQKNGWLRMVEAIGYQNSQQNFNQRTDRDVPSGTLGFYWIKTSVVDGQYWTTPNYQDFDASTCHGPSTPRQPYYLTGQIYVDDWPQWLTDCRTGSDCATKYDVSVLALTNNFGETYYYGSWVNPRTGLAEGLGLIQFDPPPGFGASTINNYLADCSQPLPPPCYTCPDS